MKGVDSEQPSFSFDVDSANALISRMEEIELKDLQRLSLTRGASEDVH